MPADSKPVKYADATWEQKAAMHYTDSFNMAQQALGLMNSISGPSAVSPQMALQQSIVVSQLSAAHAGLANYCMTRSVWGGDKTLPRDEAEGEGRLETESSGEESGDAKLHLVPQRSTVKTPPTSEQVREPHPAYEVPNSETDTES